MEPFLGQIQAFGFNFPPRGWAFCDGQLLPISQNSALFSLLGTTYGGDGRTTFALPDLRSRSIVHPGQGPGLDRITQGQRGGSYQAQLNVTNMPSHKHNVAVTANSTTGEEANVGTIISNHDGAFHEESNGAVLGGVTEQAVGGNQAFNIRNPFLGVYVSIALQGIFPSRS